MGLNTIADILGKKGESHVSKLLNEELIITEKIDTFRIMFERKNNELIFYKKDNQPITLIERTINDIWESALLEIPTLINDESKLPEGIRFGVAYTPIERPLRLPYTNLPRYILTDMSRIENGKIVESYDYDEITHWAGILCMGRPPIIFKGKLSEEQKKTLISYNTKEYEEDFSTFSQMISKLFGTSYSKESIIEGIVIKSGKNLTQIVSYEFELLDEAYKKINKSRDFYDIVIMSLTEFMNNYKFPTIKSQTSDEKYIEIINDIFIKFYESNRINENLEPTYLKSPQYNEVGKLNTKFINNKIVVDIINTHPIYEALYKVVLSSFRKNKKPYGLLSENMINKFNTYVSLICDITNKNEILEDDDNTLNESRSNNVTVKTLKRKNPSDIDTMRVISSVQNAFTPQTNNIKYGETRCAVYLTSFCPFTNAQLTNIEQIHNQWNIPVIIAAISNKNNINGKDFHLSDDIVKGQMRSLSNFNKNLIPSFMMLETWNLKEIFEFCRPNYEPLLIITDAGKKAELSLQLFYEEEIMGGKINVLDEFNIGEMENKDLLAASRSIEDGNGSLFIEITPKAIHNFYDSIINTYRTWEGAVIQQFKPIEYLEIK